jgi:hypothetical protein
MEPISFANHVLRHLRAVADAEAEAEAEPEVQAMRVLRLRCCGQVFGVHAFVAAYHSEYIRVSTTTHVRVTSPSAFDVVGDPAALGRVVECMYSDDQSLIGSITSVDDAIATLHVANFLQFRALERACAEWVDNWVDACADGEPSRDADVLLCADLWARLAEEALVPPGHPLPRTVRRGLVDMLAQRHVSDPVVLAALRRITLDALACLTGNRARGDNDYACPVLAIELALAWSAVHGADSEHRGVLGHIDLDVLPTAYLTKLSRSDRLGFDDKRALQRANGARAIRDDDDAFHGIAGNWVGRFGSVALSEHALALIVTPLVGYPIDVDGTCLQHTSQCVVVEGRAFTFKALAPEPTFPRSYAGVHAQTGYTLCGGKWRAFGVVPRFMRDGCFAAAAYGTCVYFVAMTTHHCARFDVATGQWTVLPPLRTPRVWPCIAILGQFMYVLGGLGGGGLAGADAFAPLPTERMALGGDEQQFSWQLARVHGAAPFARIATYRCAAAAAADGSAIYVLGGCFREPRRPNLVLSSDALTRFDPDGGSVEMQPMLYCRHGLGAFATESGHIVALGGRHHREERVPLAECFDPTTRAWRALEVVF